MYMSPLTSGEICQLRFGHISVLCAQRLSRSVHQLSEHQRRSLGHIAQHPSGSTGEQYGPQTGTVTTTGLFYTCLKKE